MKRRGEDEIIDLTLDTLPRHKLAKTSSGRGFESPESFSTSDRDVLAPAQNFHGYRGYTSFAAGSRGYTSFAAGSRDSTSFSAGYGDSTSFAAGSRNGTSFGRGYGAGYQSHFSHQQWTLQNRIHQTWGPQFM